VEEREPLHTVLGMQINMATVENTMMDLKILKIALPYYPERPLLSIYPKEMKSVC
jgi:hypothetical protein